ncbi:MAG TPA: FAD-binding oxidoreductase [Streptosporangiaceae bacterium]|jgi:glycolate oxidase FAD binding subunit|nr:FAD-binding oxidoreductase [Streptosporangiaceae bacterium]
MDTERALAAAVRPALASACPALRDGDALDAVGGVTPSFVGLPASTAEASALLRVAASFGLAVVPRGAGHGLGWGLPPTACDLVVDTSAMDQVIEHAAGDLVARVQAGATIGQVASVLAEAGQQLVLDAPADATVGGVIATGTAGPRRFRYGSPRDLLIGVTAVRADGVVAHAGGKVVKNVAGYDIGKLLAGSQGTLALITEATFRLHPLPPAVAWVTAEFGPADRGAAAVALQSAAGSALVPSAVELDWPPSSAQASSRAPRALRVGVLLEGTLSGVAERARLMSELLASAGGSPAVAVGEAAPPRWGQLPSPSTVIRVSFWVSGLAGVLDAVAAAAAGAGVRPAVTGSAGAGALYACLDPGTEHDATVRFALSLRERLAAGPPAAAGRSAAEASGSGGPRGPRGSVVVLAAPAPVLAAAGADGVYGPVPGAPLMRAIKDQFDPDHRMFPGRLAAI